jgi:hypothetical protein
MVGSGGDPRVVPYHKSVLDWLDPASGDRDGSAEQAASVARPSQRHAYSMDTTVGHRLLGQAAGQLVLMTADQALAASAKQRSCESHQLCPEEMPALPLLGGRYALRHAVTHLCQAAEGAAGEKALATLAASTLLHKLLLHPGFWQQAYGAGEGVMQSGKDVVMILVMKTLISA